MEIAYENRNIDFYRNDGENLPLSGEDSELQLIIDELDKLEIKASKNDADDFWGWYSQMVCFVMWTTPTEFDKEAKELAIKFFKQ